MKTDRFWKVLEHGHGKVTEDCECGANWEQGDFEITEEGYFIDYKYRDKE